MAAVAELLGRASVEISLLRLAETIKVPDSQRDRQQSEAVTVGPLRTTLTSILTLTLLTLSLAAPGRAQAAKYRSGFNVTESAVDVRDIKRIGSTNSIRAIVAPHFSTAADTGLPADERVVGVVIGNAARAYPVRMLGAHLAVNDQIGGQRFTVTYSASALTFATNLETGYLEFGIAA